MTALRIGCLECNEPTGERREGAQFCCSSCRMAFNNRRRDRGAEMYDLFRALRRERDTAKVLKLWTKMTQLELHWQEEDERERPGRRSYTPPKRAIENLQDRGRLPRGDLLVRSHFSGRKPAAQSVPQRRQ
jgi:hypothetical protein